MQKVKTKSLKGEGRGSLIHMDGGVIIGSIIDIIDYSGPTDAAAKQVTYFGGLITIFLFLIIPRGVLKARMDGDSGPQ